MEESVKYYSVELLMEECQNRNIFPIDKDIGICYGSFSDILTVNEQIARYVTKGFFANRRELEYQTQTCKKPFGIIAEEKDGRYYDIITGIEIHDGQGRLFGDIDGIAFKHKMYRTSENVKMNLKRIDESLNPMGAVQNYKKKMQQVLEISKAKYKECSKSGENNTDEYIKKFSERYK